MGVGRVYLRCESYELGFKPCILQWEALNCEFHPDHVSLHWGWGYCDEIVSQPLLPSSCGIFSFAWYIEVAQLGFRFLSEEIVLCIAANSVCPREEVSSGASYVAILNWNIWPRTSEFFFVLRICFCFRIFVVRTGFAYRLAHCTDFSVWLLLFIPPPPTHYPPSC